MGEALRTVLDIYREHNIARERTKQRYLASHVFSLPQDFTLRRKVFFRVVAPCKRLYH